MEIDKMKVFSTGAGNVLASFGFRMGGFAVHDCLPIQKRSGERIVIMPRNRRRQDIIHPLDRETREELTRKAVEAYERKERTWNCSSLG